MVQKMPTNVRQIDIQSTTGLAATVLAETTVFADQKPLTKQFHLRNGSGMTVIAEIYAGFNSK